MGNQNKISDKQLLQALRDFAEELGKTPTYTEMDNKGPHSGYTYESRFGKWNNALREAGLEVNWNISDEKALQNLREFAEELDKVPTTREMNNSGPHSSEVYKYRFGKWNNALREAGLEPNQEKTAKGLSDKELLTELQRINTDRTGPPAPKRAKEAQATYHTYQHRFGSWWKAVVRSGLQPASRSPLTSNQFERFHDATLDRRVPSETLNGLFTLFTGLTPNLISEIEQSWFDHLTDERYDTVLTVPPSYTNPETAEWTMKLPKSYTTNEGTKKTHLPEFTKWFFDQTEYSVPCEGHTRRTIYKIAQDTDLDRRTVTRDGVGVCPKIAPEDLRATLGVKMARQGAPKRRIERHVGVKHTDWKADVEDIFLWLYVQEGYEHPDYDPPDVVLDPG
jgi:hypothetical protein